MRQSEMVTMQRTGRGGFHGGIQGLGNLGNCGGQRNLGISMNFPMPFLIGLALGWVLWRR